MGNNAEVVLLLSYEASSDIRLMVKKLNVLIN